MPTVPCKPAIPELPRTWAMPAAPISGGSVYKYALLALTFSDVASPPASTISAYYAGGAFKTFLDGASSGCFSYEIDGYDVPLGVTQKDGTTCRITHATDVPDLVGISGGFDPAAYDTIILMVVQDQCATSGGLGTTTRSLNGASVTYKELFYSITPARVAATSCTGWTCPVPPVGGGVMLHELIHSAGYQLHSNAYKCLDEPSSTLLCGFHEYGDLCNDPAAMLEPRARRYLPSPPRPDATCPLLPCPSPCHAPLLPPQLQTSCRRVCSHAPAAQTT